MRSDRGAGAAVELINVTKRYNEEIAVHNVSVEIRGAEFVTLLGPSGSGKTTILNMISGFTDPTDGEILLDGKPISGIPPNRRNVGMVFQHYALFPHMSALGNVAFPLKQRRLGKSEIRKRAFDALDAVHLAHLAHRYPRELSGGEQQRVALARATVFNPRALLLDEPLGALDRKLRERLQLEIRRIHQNLGITFIYVTHDQEEALVLSDRIAVLNQGQVEQVGTGTDLYERPETRFVAGFLGESNMIAGRVEVDGGDCILITDGTTMRVPASKRVAAGSDGVLVVRPERLRVVEGDRQATSSEMNTLVGEVIQVIYMGSSQKLEIDLGTGTTVFVRQQAGATSAVAPGDRVKVQWRVEDSILVPHG